jgi:hypothetical protein
MRINTPRIKTLTLETFGVELNPRDHADQFFISLQDVIPALTAQLDNDPELCKFGGVLQFGMLVDNFSPTLVREGTTLEVLQIILARTALKIRILTKSGAVATEPFIQLFKLGLRGIEWVKNSGFLKTRASFPMFCPA